MSNVSRGVSKKEWLLTGLEELKTGGIEAVKIERLSKTIGVARAGFYWHFGKKENLLESMLEFWAEEYTFKYLRNPELVQLPAREKLHRIAENVRENKLGNFEIAVRAWAQSDPRAAATYEKVIATRLNFISQAYSELGFKGMDLEMRSHVYVCYVSWERPMKPDESEKDRRDIVERLLDLLATHSVD